MQPHKEELWVVNPKNTCLDTKGLMVAWLCLAQYPLCKGTVTFFI